MKLRGITRNRYVRLGNYLLGRIGIRYFRGFIYVRDLRQTGAISTKAPAIALDEIRFATEQDVLESDLGENTGRFLKNLRDGHYMVAAFHQGKIIGYAWISCKDLYVPELEKNVSFDGAHLWRVHVDSEFRNKGVGRALLEETLALSRERLGSRKAYSIVERDNIPSQRVFEANAFHQQTEVTSIRFLTFRREREKNLA
jgi:ribosomal protein S18 acetylase RimI-like enzyme